MHDGLSPSDILAVRELANALDAKRLLQGVGSTAGQAERGNRSVGHCRKLVHVRVVVWGRVDVWVLNHPYLPLLAPLDDLDGRAAARSPGGLSRWWSGVRLSLPSRTGAGGRARVRGGAAGRWRDVGRRRGHTRAATPGAALGACAAAGGHVLAVSGDLVGAAGGLHQRLEHHRLGPLSVVGTLAGLPGPTQPSPGRPGGVRPNRRLPNLSGG